MAEEHDVMAEIGQLSREDLVLLLLWLASLRQVETAQVREWKRQTAWENHTRYCSSDPRR